MRHLPLLLPLMLVACEKKDKGGEDGPPGVEEACATQPALRATEDSVWLEAEGCAGVSLDTFTVHGDGEARLELFTDGRQLVVRLVAVSDLSFRALRASGTWWAAGDAPGALWRQGFQSRSPSGVVPLGPLALDGEGLPLLVDGERAGAEGAASVSWWGGLAGRPGGGSVFVGTLGARQTTSRVAFDADEVHLVWGGAGEVVELGAGRSIFLDPLWLGVGGDPVALWRDWAEAAAHEAEAVAPEQAPSVGWVVGEPVDPGAVDAAVQALDAAGGAHARVDTVVLGPGWARSWGDWAPDGELDLVEAVQAVGASGRGAGIWMAPFLVDPAAPVHGAHPDWWVGDGQGELRLEGGHAVLDVTHPDALEWMRAQVAQRAEEGFEVLWLDHLYAGAAEGLRQEAVTGAEAYRRGLQALQEAADGATVVAAGAPMLPSVGRVHAWQVGPFPGAQEERLRRLGAAVAARSVVQGRWWWNLAGPLVVEEATSGAVVTQALGAGPWWLTGDPQGLPGAGLVEDVVEVRGQGVEVHDALVAPVEGGAVPVRWTLEGGTVGLLNLGQAPVEVDGPGGRELWSGEEGEPGRRVLQPGEGELWR